MPNPKNQIHYRATWVLANGHSIDNMRSPCASRLLVPFSKRLAQGVCSQTLRVHGYGNWVDIEWQSGGESRRICPFLHDEEIARVAERENGSGPCVCVATMEKNGPVLIRRLVDLGRELFDEFLERNDALGCSILECGGKVDLLVWTGYILGDSNVRCLVLGRACAK